MDKNEELLCLVLNGLRNALAELHTDVFGSPIVPKKYTDFEYKVAMIKSNLEQRLK